ncbi:MAG: hypothetical protein PHE84_08965 [bacterium]|nr:hypothetical protein [bacterium]
MKRKIFLFGLLLAAGLTLLLGIGPAGAEDLKARFQALKTVTPEMLKQMADGTVPWPEWMFPLSSWTDEEIKKLPPEFWQKVRAQEKQWPEYIARQAGLFRQEYGPGIKNYYDLFLDEQAEMKKPGYEKVSPPVEAKKTLKRLIDLAYLPAEKLGSLQGNPLNNIRAFSFNKGRLRVLPLDILEISPAGRVVLPSGPEGNPQDGDGIFNGRDRIFFMVLDAGHKVAKNFVREKIPGIKDLEEAEISYPAENEKGWVYLASFGQNPPEKSPADNIQFCPETSITFNPFSLNQTEPRKMKGKIVPTLKIRSWFTPPAMGGLPIDIYDRLRIRIALRFHIGSTGDNEDELNVSWRAWYDGQVISYNRAAWKQSTPLGIGAPVVFDDILANAFSVYDYITYYSPFDPAIFMKDFEVIIGEEMNRNAREYTEALKGWHLTERDRTGYAVDGMMSEREKTRDPKWVKWHLFTGMAGSVLMRVDYDEYLQQHSTITLDWRDDDTAIGNYDTHMVVHRPSTRTEHFLLEWNVVPFFFNEDHSKFGWDNLDLVLKRVDKPVVFALPNGEKFSVERYLNVPNVGKEFKFFKF